MFLELIIIFLSNEIIILVQNCAGQLLWSRVEGRLQSVQAHLHAVKNIINKPYL